MNQEVNSLLKYAASLVGFADLSELDDNSRDGFPFGVSIAVTLNPQIVSEIGDGPTRRYVEEYLRVNAILKNLAMSLEYFLVRKGFQAKAITGAMTTGGYEANNHSTKLPHKTVATRAGLGWIGKCALLVTKQYGSCLRLISVLTNAPLSPAKPINVSFCGDCTECVKICPEVVSGRNWQLGMTRESFYDASACFRTATELALKMLGKSKSGRKRASCGRCMAVCPWTKKYIGRNKENLPYDESELWAVHSRLSLDKKYIRVN